MVNPWMEIDGNVAKCDKERILSLQSSIRAKQNPLHIELPPHPFYGNVRQSKLLLLSLNPGFGECDHQEQSMDADFRKELSECLLQTKDAKLFSINNRFGGTSHGRWWRKRTLLQTDQEIHKMIFGSVDKYADFLENNLSVIEFFGYHTKTTPDYVWARSPLPSQLYSFELVRESIRAKKRILIMRSKKLWERYVTELTGYPYLYLRSPQNVSLSENNVVSPDGKKWSDIVAEMRNGIRKS
ncbi:MAG: hypothetical protein LBS91_08065 [Clostridiales Family XIII bacterium]|jgi:hypothetical protein|nr:hypothetical protein [Clostridiales Family XIII bacterium]